MNKNDRFWSWLTVFCLNEMCHEKSEVHLLFHHRFEVENLIDKISLTTSVSHKTFSLSRTGRNDFYTLASLEQWEVTSQRNSSDNGHSVQPINNRFFLFAIWFIYYCTFLDRGNQYNCVLSQINCTVWFREPYSGTKKQRESLCSRLHFWLPTPSTMSSNKVGTQQQA